MRWLVPAAALLLLGCSATPTRLPDGASTATWTAARDGRAPPLTAAELEAAFRIGFASVDHFCASQGDCRPSAEKRALFDLYFRGSFAEVAGASDADSAYARQAVAYFTQPDYACRRPLTSRVLETLWQLSPRAGCAEGVPFLVDLDDGSRAVRRIDPSRVAAIHLLFAGPSGRSFSRFGHAGLRLVVCAPGHQPDGAACDIDLQEHLSLGFRAAIDELDLSIWKGIFGGYPVRLYAGPFMAAYREYTIDEFRSLASLPMHLSATQRELLVRALGEVHWSYQNDYRFLTQNCASELSWLLRVVSAVTGAEPAWLAEGNVRPDRLYARALKSEAFDAAALADERQAERDGFWFPSSRAYYELALATLGERLHARGAVNPAKDWDAFRVLDAATRRQQLYAPALAADADATTLDRAAQAALVLEAWTERRQRRELLSALSRYYAEITKTLLARTDYFSADERALLQRCIEGFRASDGLGRAADGVPMEDPDVNSSGCALRSAPFTAALQKLFDVAPPAVSHERQLAELRGTIDNMHWLVPRLGALPDDGSATPPNAANPG